MKFRKKPIVIEAKQWFVAGDHPDVVAYESVSIDCCQICDACYKTMNLHGWVETLEGGHVACPGDWIITGIKNEKYPCKPDIFEQTYERVD